MPGGGAVAVLRDLTETERVEKTRRDFIANVSHELRTPLTSIQGYTETLLDSASDNDHSREFLEIIRKSAVRMSRLTEDLLTLARVESGEQRFDIEPTAPADLLQEAVQSFREIARMQNVELMVEDQAAARVGADPEAIHQVFSNLVDNAMKYAQSGGRIILGARPVSRGRRILCAGFRPRHSLRAPAAPVRALLPGGQGALARIWRNRAGTGDCQTYRAGPWRLHSRPERTQPRINFPVYPAAGLEAGWRMGVPARRMKTIVVVNFDPRRARHPSSRLRSFAPLDSRGRLSPHEQRHKFTSC